jgi:hypothetical protein
VRPSFLGESKAVFWLSKFLAKNTTRTRSGRCGRFLAKPARRELETQKNTEYLCLKKKVSPNHYSPKIYSDFLR